MRSIPASRVSCKQHPLYVSLAACAALAASRSSKKSDRICANDGQQQGRAKQAIVQLEKAVKLTDDVERKEEIKALLKELRAELARRRTPNDQ